MGTVVLKLKTYTVENKNKNDSSNKIHYFLLSQ